MTMNGTINWRIVASAIRNKRTEDNLTTRELASKLNLSASTICRLEAGRAVSADVFMVMARWLNKHPALFLK